MAKILSSFCPNPETEFKGARLIHLMEEILGLSSILAVAGILFTAFSQGYNKIQEQKSEQKYLKNFGLKRALFKVGTKRSVAVEQVSIIKKKSSILN